MFLIETKKGNIEITQEALFGMITSHIDSSELKDVKFLGFKNKQNFNNTLKKGMSNLLKKDKDETDNSYDIVAELEFEVTKLTSLADKGKEIQDIVSECLHSVLDVDKEKVLIKVFFENFNDSEGE